jgi:hypothetical protein
MNSISQSGNQPARTGTPKKPCAKPVHTDSRQPKTCKPWTKPPEDKTELTPFCGPPPRGTIGSHIPALLSTLGPG